MMGKTVVQTAQATADRDCIGAAKLVVFCNAPEDNPFMAGAFHGVGEADTVINVGVSGPGVVRAALAKGGEGKNIAEIADMVKKTAFKITRMGQLVAKKQAKDFAFLLVSLTFHLHLHRQSAIVLHIFLKKWDLKYADVTVQLLLLHFLTMLLRKAA